MAPALVSSSHGVFAELSELVALRPRAMQLGRVERHRSADQLSGLHASPFRGRGMEYAESRPYAAGDDVRHIDWRVTARTGRTHTKLFQPERERITAVLYDASPSMAFGTRNCFKSVQAARLAGLMIWAALTEGDRLAASVCGRPREVVAPLGARRGALRALDALVRWQRPSVLPSVAAATLAESLDALQRTLRPGSHVLLVVDPRSVDVAAERSLARMHARHDVVACVLADVLEVAPPPPARYGIAHQQRRSQLSLENADVRQAWVEHFQRQHDDVLNRLRRAGVRARLTLTHEDPVHALRELLSTGRLQPADAGSPDRRNTGPAVTPDRGSRADPTSRTSSWTP